MKKIAFGLFYVDISLEVVFVSFINLAEAWLGLIGDKKKKKEKILAEACLV